MTQPEPLPAIDPRLRRAIDAAIGFLAQETMANHVQDEISHGRMIINYSGQVTQLGVTGIPQLRNDSLQSLG